MFSFQTKKKRGRDKFKFNDGKKNRPTNNKKTVSLGNDDSTDDTSLIHITCCRLDVWLCRLGNRGRRWKISGERSHIAFGEQALAVSRLTEHPSILTAFDEGDDVSNAEDETEGFFWGWRIRMKNLKERSSRSRRSRRSRSG